MTGQEAMFARIATRLRDEIRDGTWLRGELLPGEVELAARYGAARATLVRALDLLRREGIIITINGVGSRVAVVPVTVTVVIGAGDYVTARMPAVDEQARLGMSPGVPLLVVTRADGAGPEVYDGAVTRIGAAG